MTNKIFDELKTYDENAIININVNENAGLFGTEITGVILTTKDKSEMSRIFAKNMPAASVSVKFINIPNITNQKNPINDEVKTLYMGMLKLSYIRDVSLYKRDNQELTDKVKDNVDEFGVITPLILDNQLNIIDGHNRYELATINELEYVPVMVLDADDKTAKALRLTLNRASEYQRWNYEEVDEYVDSHAELQPILEPLGFFSNNILPTSFFANTVVQYKEDEYNDQMKKYMQDKGLLEWAAEMRKKAAHDEEVNKKHHSKHDLTNRKGLFSIEFTKDDFVPTYNAQEVMDKHIEKMNEVADTITTNYDKKRKEEMEAKGQKWQGTRRTSKQLAKDKRLEAEESEVNDTNE